MKSEKLRIKVNLAKRKKSSQDPISRKKKLGMVVCTPVISAIGGSVAARLTWAKSEILSPK
jgi:hypothetical protein